jgi:ligand-binding sensor domain-containing protein
LKKNKSLLIWCNPVFFILIIITTFIFLQAKIDQPTFEHLSLEKGISHNLTRCIMQDSKGFMWFGTMFGLIKFDGISYTAYRNHPGDSLSLSHDDILCMIEDRNNYLWIGTRGGGLNRFDQRTKTFIRFNFNPDDSTSISNNFINTLCEDSLGNLWIGTDFGLNKLDKNYLEMENGELRQENVNFKRYNSNLWNIQSISDAIVKSILCSDGYIWIGTRNGFNKFDPVSNVFKRYHSYNPLYTKVYIPKVFDIINILKNENKLLVSIVQPVHFVNIIKEFFLADSAHVLVFSQGEGRSEFRGEPVMSMRDFGYIEEYESNDPIWQMTFKQSRYGGGAEKNRVQIDVLTLPKGKYRLRYQSDDSHGFGNWNNTPPDFPQDWGIQVFRIDKKQADILKKILGNEISFKQNSVSDNNISSIIRCAKKKQLWIGTGENGLDKYDIITGKFTHYLHNPQNNNSLVDNNVNTLYEDDDCILWIGTSGGISRFDEESGTFTAFKHEPLNTNSISSNFVYAIYKDLSDILWCGTYWGGIDKLDFKAKRFEHIQKNISSSSKLAENNFQSILELDEKTILIGTWGDGLILYGRNSKSFKNFYYNADNPNSISNNFIRTIYKDRNDQIWIGTYGGGLNKFDIKNEKFKRYYYDSRNPNSISSNFIITVYQDTRSNLWIGTDGGGLNKLNQDNNSFTRYQHLDDNNTSISSNDIYCMYEDDHNILWIGTASGLDKFNVSTNQFDHYLQESYSLNFLSNNYVYSILVAHHGRDSSMWVGTASGLYRFDPQSGNFKRYTEENGLPNRVICGILEDNNGFLWMSTNRGLSRFDPKMKIFNNYDVADGLQSNMFNIGSFCKFKNGELGFAGINGLNIFQPDNIISNTFVPPVYIIGIKKFDQPMSFDMDLTDLSQIELSYKDNYFTIEFVALDYSHPEKNVYAYKLEGVNERWIHSNNENFASYTNIDPGEYVFKVRGTNSDGVWNMEGDELAIIIKPPFWMALWFRTIIILIITLSFAFTVYIIIKREKQKTAINKKISELKLQALQAQMNPHFIFNTINAIQYFISKKDNDSAYFYLTKFSRLLRQTLENSEKLRIPLDEELELLKLYLELQLLRYGNKFSYHIDIDPEIDTHIVEIPSMVFQPYIENSIQHGFSSKRKGGKLVISIKQNNNMLVCTIKDNGVGIKKSLSLKKEKDSVHKSSGMKLIADRLEIINTAHKDNIHVSIDDLNDLDKKESGTCVTLQIPVY